MVLDQSRATDSIPCCLVVLQPPAASRNTTEANPAGQSQKRLSLEPRFGDGCSITDPADPERPLAGVKVFMAVGVFLLTAGWYPKAYPPVNTEMRPGSSKPYHRPAPQWKPRPLQR